MLMTRLSVLLVLLTLGCDDASTALVSADAATIADAATDAMVVDGDAGSPRDVALPEDGSADSGADIPDGQPPAPDSATADRGVADVLIPDAARPSPTPVDPCGDDLQVVCGVIQPAIPALEPSAAGDLDPSVDGPYSVITSDHTVQGPQGFSIAVTVFAPDSAEQSLPLVLALPGFGATYQQYRFMTRHLVSHGFLVVGTNVAEADSMHPAEHDRKVARVLRVLDWVLDESPVAGRVDPERIASMGHSLGGKLSFYAAALDSRIDAVVAWDPQNGGGPPCFLAGIAPGDCNDFPVAPNCEANDPGLIHQMQAESLTFGAEDRLITPDSHLWAQNFYRGAPSPAHFVAMPAVGHGAWFADGEVTRLTRGAHTAFLLNRLKGVTGLETWLPGGERLEAGSGVTEVLSK